MLLSVAAFVHFLWSATGDGLVVGESVMVEVADVLLGPLILSA